MIQWCEDCKHSYASGDWSDGYCGECIKGSKPGEIPVRYEQWEVEPQEQKKISLQPTCNNLATDTIYRQAAIDALDCINGVEEVLRSLPSAQPPVPTCKGCRHVGTYDTNFPCSRCIRREKDYYEQER